MTQIHIDPVYVLIAGLLVNVLMAAVKREHWSANVTKSVTVGLSVAAGFVAVLAQQKGLDAQSLGASIAATLGVNQAAYGLLLNQTPLGPLLSGLFNPAAHPVDANTATAAEVAATVVDVAKPAVKKSAAVPPVPPTK